MPKKEPTVLLEKKGPIAYITFNRPEKLNAFRLEEYYLLDDIVNDCDKDKKIKAMIITGKGRGWSTADDVDIYNKKNEEPFKTAWEEHDVDTIHHGGMNISQRTFLTLMESPKVSIAAVNGPCWLIGILAACDFAIAADVATFTDGDVRMGWSPGSNETVGLTRLLGRRHALEFLLTSQPISAQEAYRIGLVNKVVSLAQLMPEAEKLANLMASYLESGIHLTKLSVNTAHDLPLRQAILAETAYTKMSLFYSPNQWGKVFVEKGKKKKSK